MENIIGSGHFILVHEGFMLTIWGRKTSSNVQLLMWCIGEIELSYKRYDIGHKYGGADTDEFYHLNPNCTVPVLQDGDSEPLWETGAILRYLASKYANDIFGQIMMNTEELI